MILLKIENLFVKYHKDDSHAALDGVSFSIGEGERVALIGANGAGKSTLLLTLVGILTPASGSVLFDGIKLEKSSITQFRKKIGLVFQNPDDQLFMPGVYEDIAFGPRNMGVGEQKIEAMIDKTLQSFGILHLKRRSSHKLSGGEKRIVTLAGVLVMEPRLILMDEPSSFLDPRACKRLAAILKELPQAMLLATHDLNLALALCDRAILLKEGKIAADGSSQTILKDIELLDFCGLC